MKRIFLAIGSLGLVALLSVTAIGGVVDAQTSTPAGTSDTSTPKKDQFLSALAGKLGVSTDALQSAIEQTTEELGFGPARFGERLRERIHDRIEKRRGRMLDHVDLSQAATFLGISSEQLKTELQGDKSFIEVARDHGKTDDQIRAFLIERATAAIDEHLQAPSDAGTPAGV